MNALWNLSWLQVGLIIAAFAAAAAAVVWASRKASAVTTAATVAEARDLSGFEQAALARIATRPYPAWVFRDGRTIADDLRKAFPDVADDDLARFALHARRLIAWQHAHGRNCVQIAHVLGTAACDLAALDVTRHGQVTK